MTPATIRIISQLRGEFYSLFATAMNVPVRITGKSYSNNAPIVTWVDSRQKLNYLNVYAYSAPDAFIPERPFLLRVAINKSAGRLTFINREQECRGVNREWNFELTVLPEEVLDFLPWIVSLVKAQEKGLPPQVKEPPHQCDLKALQFRLFSEVWTEKARTIAAIPIPQSVEG